MAKFNVGDKVRLTIKDRHYLNGFQDNDICIIINTNCGGEKEYQIKLPQGGNIGYAMEEELELIEDIIKVGYTVQPKSFCIGYPDYFRIVRIKMDCNISYDLEQLTFNGKTLRPMQLQNWKKTDFNVVPSIDCPMDIVTQQVLADIKTPIYIDKLDERIENYKEMFSKEGENYMKILEIYSREAFSKIDEKYDKLKKEAIEEDNVQKVIEDTENQINVMLDIGEDKRISIGLRNYFEPKTQVKLVELEKEKDAEKIKVEKLIEEVKARLEICDNNETSKVAVLKEYEILDKDGKIAEYKIKKKGRI